MIGSTLAVTWDHKRKYTTVHCLTRAWPCSSRDTPLLFSQLKACMLKYSWGSSYSSRIQAQCYWLLCITQLLKISIFPCTSNRTVVMHGLSVWLAVWHQVVEQEDSGANDFRNKHAAESLGWWSVSWDPLAACMESDPLLQVTND